VAVNAPVVAGRPLPWKGRTLRVDVRPEITGRHFDGSAADLRSLAGVLAACHAALARFDGSAAVRAAASARYRRLAAVREEIGAAVAGGDLGLFAEQAAWAARHRDWLLEMAGQFTARLDELPGAQCLHGEVHPGNVLFRSGDDGAVLVDFEESVHVFAPPAWDLAFLVQRFCLGDDPAPGVARRRVSTAADAYAGPWPRLAPMMRQAAWFSVAVIVEARTAYGVITAADEYDKFVRLERQARAFEEAL
jgi:Ser/Thr protein kinase RdoA (MazF antagonist)